MPSVVATIFNLFRNSLRVAVASVLLGSRRVYMLSMCLYDRVEVSVCVSASARASAMGSLFFGASG